MVTKLDDADEQILGRIDGDINWEMKIGHKLDTTCCAVLTASELIHQIYETKNTTNCSNYLLAVYIFFRITIFTLFYFIVEGALGLSVR